MKYCATALSIALAASTVSAGFLRNQDSDASNLSNLVPAESPRELQANVLNLPGFKAIVLPTAPIPPEEQIVVVVAPVAAPETAVPVAPTAAPVAPTAAPVAPTAAPVVTAGDCTSVAFGSLIDDEYVSISYAAADLGCVDLTKPRYQEMVADAFLAAYVSNSAACTQSGASCEMYQAEFAAYDPTAMTVLIRTGTYCNAWNYFTGEKSLCGVELFDSGVAVAPGGASCACARPTSAEVLASLNAAVFGMVDACIPTLGAPVVGRQSNVWATASTQLCELPCAAGTAVPGQVAGEYTVTAAGVVAPCNNPPLTISPAPTVTGTKAPSAEPTKEPTKDPTKEPTKKPIASPTDEPVVAPTDAPEVAPTAAPVVEPTNDPTKEPTKEPVAEPTDAPVVQPTKDPTKEPTKEPVAEPTDAPEKPPTRPPTAKPVASESSEESEESGDSGGSVTSRPAGGDDD